MSVVHFATELSGGAGSFVRNIHITMQSMGLPSLVITRERNDLSDSITVKPLMRARGALRARWLAILGKLGFINRSYAMFGIERAPVGWNDIQRALGSQKPTAFIFYWISYFIHFETILLLRQAYPTIPVVFVCTDEAFLTGGCHYSQGCLAYQKSCSNCPVTSLKGLKNRIEKGYLQRQALIAAINPIIIYPTTNIQEMGRTSAVFKNIRSAVIPLGAISNRELSLVEPLGRKDNHEIVTLLIRSSSDYRKGCDLFVSALQMVNDNIPNLRSRLKVISIGDETLKQAQIDKYVDHVDMGYVNRDDLMSIYRKVDAFIVTSREDGGPLMTNESIALGIFVISTPIGVAHDLITGKQSGFITRDTSSEAISEALMMFLRDHKTDCFGPAALSASQTLKSSLTFEDYIYAMMDRIQIC